MTDPERRLYEAEKQLSLAGEDDALTTNQKQAASALRQIVTVLRESIETTREAEIVADGGLQPAAQADYYSEGSFTTCPDCGGELQYQNRESVTCQDCATEFGHYKRTNGCNTLLRAPDNERAAQVYDPADDQCRDSAIVADGGLSDEDAADLLTEVAHSAEAALSADELDKLDRVVQYLRYDGDGDSNPGGGE